MTSNDNFKTKKRLSLKPRSRLDWWREALSTSRATFGRVSLYRWKSGYGLRGWLSRPPQAARMACEGGGGTKWEKVPQLRALQTRRFVRSSSRPSTTILRFKRRRLESLLGLFLWGWWRPWKRKLWSVSDHLTKKPTKPCMLKNGLLITFSQDLALFFFLGNVLRFNSVVFLWGWSDRTPTFSAFSSTKWGRDFSLEKASIWTRWWRMFHVKAAGLRSHCSNYPRARYERRRCCYNYRYATKSPSIWMAQLFREHLLFW